jgi:Chaperone of endosialidase
MANKFQVKRTSVSGRTPNTTSSGNTHFIDTGELALNLTDGKLFSSNGSASFEVGANLANLMVTSEANVSSLKVTSLANVSTLNVAGDANVAGKLSVTASSGDEGGEIFLAPAANTTLAGGITIDSYQNKLRFFEQGGSARGAYIDLTACAGGAGTNLLTGGSGISQVNTGNGLTGGPITSSGTVSVLANTGIIANATGLYVNSTYIATLAATGDTINIGSSAFIANSTAVVIAEPLTANGATGTSGQVLTSNGTTGSPYWSTVSGGLTIVDDTSTNATRYITFEDSTSGSTSNLGVSSTKLTFNPSTGRVSATVFTSTSDEHLKTNINTITDSLSKIHRLKGITFNYREGNHPGVGVIAQDVEQIFPELVSVNGDGYKSVAYDGLIGLLIEAVKEQQQQINYLNIQMNEMRSKTK